MVKKVKKKINIPEGIIHVKSTFNNTIVSVTDLRGNVVYASSSGKNSFKGSRKSTPFAAQISAQDCAKVAFEEFGMKKVDVHVKGPGPGRDSAVRAIGGSSLEVRSITDKTPLPHNGCRPPKKSRV